MNDIHNVSLFNGLLMYSSSHVARPADPAPAGVHGDQVRGQDDALRPRPRLRQDVLVRHQALPRTRLPQPPLLPRRRHQDHAGTPRVVK